MFEPTPWAPPQNTAARCLAETLQQAAALLTTADAVAARCGQAAAVRALARELEELAGKLDPSLIQPAAADPVQQLRKSA
jgi:hypothetical protein